MKIKLILLSLLIPVLTFGASVNISVNAGKHDRTDCVVTADVSALKLNEKFTVELVETTNGGEVATPCQVLLNGKNAELFFVLTGNTGPGQVRTYVAKKVKKAKIVETSKMKANMDDKAIVLQKNGKDVLKYNFAINQSPAGVDPIFNRGGYIHPAYTPSGFVLTNIQPADHRHHYGIWNPWTKLMYDGQVYDCWNLIERQGTVRPEAVEALYEGDVFSGFDASLNHIVFTDAGERTAMREIWKVRVYNVGDGYLWDFESELTPGSKPVTLKEYRYAGLGFRANAVWTKDNVEMMSSEGKTRQQIDNTTGRWIYTNGGTGVGNNVAGLLYMCHPDDYNYPEPIRIWNEQQNMGRGDVYMNFVPTKNMDWKLKANKTYTLKYRFYAYDGMMTPTKAEKIWSDFGEPPIVKVSKK
ncbi:MAG: PmoA family protein [Bacteroidales bacterium]|nr:PmoA family protein [Bacteroidales bacterium]